MTDTRSAVRPARLRVEYADDPLGVGTTAPEFTWAFDPPHAAVDQSAYRLQVAETTNTGFEAPVADTGWVDDGRSTGISLDDSGAIEPGTHYRWRVGAEIGGDRVWSEGASFETAPLAWTADWIAAPPVAERRHHDREPDPAPLLRRQFDLPDGAIERARAYVVGLGFNEFHCNGKKVGDAVLDPALTDYTERVLYAVHDLTGAVRPGERNVVGAWLGRGRYAFTTESEWGWHEAPWQADRPALRALVVVEYADGQVETIQTDSDWAAADSRIRFDSFYEGEVHDARVERGAWSSPGYDDSTWAAVDAIDGPGGERVVQEVQPIEVAAVITPESVETIETESEGPVHVYDVGEMVAGWVEVTVGAPTGTTVEVRHAEYLDEDGRPELVQGHIDAEIQRDVFVTSDAPADTFEPRFGYRGFRYVEVMGVPEPPESLVAKRVHSRVDRGWASAFDCDDDLLVDIHDNARRGLLSNLHGLPTESPVFEKNGWTGDGQLTAEAALYEFDMARFYRKWLDDIADAQRDDGALPRIVPTTGWGYPSDDRDPTPAWDGAYVLVPWWLYRYTGDRRSLERHYAGMTAYVDFLGTVADGHVLDIGLGDWVPPGSENRYEQMIPPEGPAITSTAYYARFAEIVAEAAATLGRPEDAAAYRSLADSIARAFNEAFWDADGGSYRTGEVEEYRQTSNVFPLAFDLVPTDREPAVVDALVRDVMETRDGHLNTGIHGTKYLLSTLTEHGHVDAAYTIATQREYPSWGYWIELGATTLWELWQEQPRSRNNHMFGTIMDWSYGHLAGIRPGEPGFRTVTVDPSPPTALDAVSATVDTHRGPIEAGWQRVQDGLDIDVAVPANTEAVVHVPAGESRRVTATGPAPVPAPTRTPDEAVYEVGAGKWSFTVR